MELIDKTTFISLSDGVDIGLIDWNIYYSVYFNQLEDYKTYSGDTFIWYFLDNKSGIPMLYIESMKVLKVPKKYKPLGEEYLVALGNESLTMDTWSLEMVSSEITLSNSDFIRGVDVEKDVYPNGTYIFTTCLCSKSSEEIEIRRRRDGLFDYIVVEAAPKKIKNSLGSNYYEVLHQLQLLKTFFKINNK